MEIYVTVAFYLGLLGLVINLTSLLVIEYPRNRKETIGEKLFIIIIGIAFCVWSGVLLYG
jgi:hypothetical protein